MSHDFEDVFANLYKMMHQPEIKNLRTSADKNERRVAAKPADSMGFLRLALQNTSLFNELLQRVDELQQSVYSPNRGSKVGPER